MKQVILLCIFYFIAMSLYAQTSNRRGIDVITGKKILDSLPATIQENTLNKQNDKVFEASGFIGVVVHRDYGGNNKLLLDVINNSPSINNINTMLLSQPSNSTNYKVTQVNGYKALIQQLNSEISKIGYELLIPVNNTLITFKAFGYTQDQFLTMANSIPIAMVARKTK